MGEYLLIWQARLPVLVYVQLRLCNPRPANIDLDTIPIQ
jgi:hypothetical protein